MPLQGWTHSSHRSTPCFLSNNRAFSNGRQNSCTCPRARRHATAPRAQEQRVQRGYGQDDAADLEKLLGDSAGRMPKQLSVSTKSASVERGCSLMLAYTFTSSVTACSPVSLILIGAASDTHPADTRLCTALPPRLLLICGDHHKRGGCRQEHRSNCSYCVQSATNHRTFAVQCNLVPATVLVVRCLPIAAATLCIRDILQTLLSIQLRLWSTVRGCQQRQS